MDFIMIDRESYKNNNINNNNEENNNNNNNNTRTETYADITQDSI